MGMAIQVPLDPEGLTSRFDWYPDAADFEVNESSNELTLLTKNGRKITSVTGWSSFFFADEDPNAPTS